MDWKRNVWPSRVNLYFKVTWLYEWLFLSRALSSLSNVFWVKEVAELRKKCASSTGEFVLQNHANFWRPFLFPALYTSNSREFFSDFQYFRSRKSIEWERNAWLSRVFLYFEDTRPYEWPFLSRALLARAVNFPLFLMYFGSRTTMEQERNAGDVVLQGHTTLWVTFHISGTWKASAVILSGVQ